MLSGLAIRGLRYLSVLLLGALLTGSPWEATAEEPTWPNSHDLVLEIALDSPEYLEGQPIYVTAIAINGGSLPIRYLPVIYTTTFKCVATRDDGQAFLLGYPQNALPPGDYSSRLEPGEAELHEYYLNSWGETLPPGDYVMEATVCQPYSYYDADAVHEDEAIVAPGMYSSNQIPFTVLQAGAQVPASTQLALNGNPVDGAPRPQRVHNYLVASTQALEQAGVKATQDKAKQEVNLSRGEASVTLPVGRWPKEMQDKHLPAIPSMGGGLLVPVRYVAESLGMRVHWDAKTKTANILTG